MVLSCHWAAHASVWMVRGYLLNYQVPDTRGWLPWGYLHNIPFPVLTCQHQALGGLSEAQQLLGFTLPPASLAFAQPGD